MEEGKEIEEALNKLILKCAKNKGYVYIVDKAHNNFILRVTEPIKINAYEGYKGETENGGKQ